MLSAPPLSLTSQDGHLIYILVTKFNLEGLTTIVSFDRKTQRHVYNFFYECVFNFE